MVRAAAHMTSGLLVSADDELVKLTATISEFENQNVVITDPRKETSEIIAAIRGEMVIC